MTLSVTNDFARLASLGWKPLFLQHLSVEELTRYAVGRITAVERELFQVHNDCDEQSAKLPGRWRHLAVSSEDYPTVGDWVLLDPADDATTPLIRRLLPRLSLLRRTAVAQEGGGGAETQLLCANVDTALIVAALDSSFNPRRIERYLSLARGSGVNAVVVLTKADHHEQPQTAVDALKKRLQTPDVVALDAVNDDARAALSPWYLSGDTLALIGPSGVGKSTLTNNLAGTVLQQTGAVREADAKGRHTTTRRSLLRLPGGVCVIDTPGMRELKLAGDDDAVGANFADLEALFALCRFGDCSHHNEPGCAVAAALDDGRLSADRWAHYQRLSAEQETQNRLREAVHQRRSRQKAFGKMTRQAQRQKRQRRDA